MKHFGTLFPFWLTVQAYALWFFLDVKIMQMLFLGIAEPTGTTDCRLTEWALLRWGKALTWALLWAEFPVGTSERSRRGIAWAPLLLPWEAHTRPILHICVSLFYAWYCIMQHCTSTICAFIYLKEKVLFFWITLTKSGFI